MYDGLPYDSEQFQTLLQVEQSIGPHEKAELSV
jgi:hypothetical protein